MLAYLTIDTEYSADMVRKRGPGCREENFATAIAGRTREGECGVGYQIARLDAHGHKGVFFVDPMPALVWGEGAVEDVVAPIIAAGHDVQLHLHTEWLELAGAANPLGGATGGNMKDLALDDQCRLIEWGRATLMAAGAPEPVAFRAGNYGANDDTVRALAQCGLRYDTSHTPGIAGGACAISLGPQDRLPVEHCGVIEVPIGCIATLAGLRHAQITALSAREMAKALRHARDAGATSFTLVSHSFELVNREKRRANVILVRRFDRLCRIIEAMPDVRTATYRDDPPILAEVDAEAVLLPPEPVANTLRVDEQLVANTLDGS